ncbi:MAG: orotate phosphoribosyltransferase [Methanobacterium sp.]|nr:MAG: orotate phosphoribosyltransferase [Methanobacterium sp.]
MELTGICNICGNAAKMHTCSICGTYVCSQCYYLDSGVCVICKKRLKLKKKF